MKLERLLYLAGVDAKEDDSVEEGKYEEPKANHAKKTGGDAVKKAPEGKLKNPKGAKYNEPAANNEKKLGGKEEKAPEGELKTSKLSKYSDNTSTK